MEFVEHQHFLEIDIIIAKYKVGEAVIDLNDNRLISISIKDVYRNCGFGSKAIKELVDRYHLDKLWVAADNKAMIHVMEKAGFETTRHILDVIYEMTPKR